MRIDSTHIPFFFFFNDTATTEIYTLSLHDALPILIPLIEKGLPFQSVYVDLHKFEQHADWFVAVNPEGQVPVLDRSEEHTSELQSRLHLVCRLLLEKKKTNP